MGLETEPGVERRNGNHGTTLGFGVHNRYAGVKQPQQPFPLYSMSRLVPVAEFSTSSGKWASKAAAGLVSGTAQCVREESVASYQFGVLVSF